MTFEEFMSGLLKPTYVWRMAAGNRSRRMLRSSETRMANARRRIDDLVLQRALSIADERRCAAVSTEPSTGDPIRCELPRGHSPVPGRRGTPGGLTMHDMLFDHAAPSRGVWWMEPEEAHA